MVERSLQYRATFAFEPIKNLVRGDFAHQYEERRGSGLNGDSGLLHPFVVNADIGQISAERAGTRRQGQRQQGASKKIRPISAPHKVPVTAPAAVVLIS